MLTGKDKETNRRIELFMVRVLGCLCGMAVVYKMACLVLDGNAYRIVYFVLYAAGLFFSVLLLLKTHGWSSGWVHRFCTDRSGKANCSSVLYSKAATLVGEITWSDVGVLYFLFMMLMVLCFCFDDNALGFIISACLAFPYALFSVWYQGRILHSWCRLCLAVQGVLALSLAWSLLFLFHGEAALLLRDWFPLLALGIGLLSGYFTAKYLLRALLHDKAVSRHYQLLKMAHPECTLYSSERIAPIAAGYQVIYHAGAAHKITVAFRFGCPSCLRDMDKVLAVIRERDDVAVEFAFVSWYSHLKQDLPFILYFVQLYLTDRIKFLDKLGEYVSDYPAHKERYSLKTDEIHASAREMIVHHIRWVAENHIQRTPTYLLDDRLVSLYYTFDDLVNILTNRNI